MTNDREDARERGVGEHRAREQRLREPGADAGGPPWILGHRGSPLEAPENTLASLRRALDLGLDGIAYDVRACQSGELVILRDETLDRTSDARGRLGEKTFVELASVDAGGWFGARFKGERLASLEEALELARDAETAVDRDPPQHVVEVHERGVASEIARIATEIVPELPLRIASSSHDVCLEARDAGTSALLFADAASERDRAFVRENAIAAFATTPRGWCTDAGRGEWSCERWSWAVDDPEDLLDAFRLPLFGIATNEPLRALATRALVRMTPDDDGAYPIQVSELEVNPGAWAGGPGEWCGSWSTSARVRNPFPFAVRAAAGVIPRHGAFDIGGLPAALELAPGESADVPFRIAGGSWRTGGDPLFFVRFRWARGPGRASGALMLDAPLKRTRTAIADVIARRLKMLRESPRDAEASMTIRRHRQHLLVSIESSGGWKDARTIVYLDGRFLYGGRGLRAVLPPDFDQRREGIAFSCGMQALVDGEWRVRRWCGGVPEEIGSGAPGRLLALKSA
jgi:glycerophosphoryl diester phosphodiesterase